MKFLRYFAIGTGVWLALFMIDYIVELFQIDGTSVLMTLMGLKITTVMTPDILDTTFALTWQALLIYVVFTGLWIMLSYLTPKLKKKEQKSCSLQR